jgi:hypothetical protein
MIVSSISLCFLTLFSFQEIEEETKLKNLRIAEITKGIMFYREYLGLDFEPVAQNKMRFIFTLLDPNDVSREFWFIVFIEPNKQFRSSSFYYFDQLCENI